MGGAIGVVLLMFVVQVSFRHGDPDARPVAARLQIAGFKKALEAYAADHGTYPEELQQLTREGYLPAEVPNDPWGKPYRYEYPGKHGPKPDIESTGSGISSWEMK